MQLMIFKLLCGICWKCCCASEYICYWWWSNPCLQWSELSQPTSSEWCWPLYLHKTILLYWRQSECSYTHILLIEIPWCFLVLNHSCRQQDLETVNSLGYSVSLWSGGCHGLMLKYFPLLVPRPPPSKRKGPAWYKLFVHVLLYP